ncbi:hypothetical protein [Clostridium paraputrificum]|uniref:hypothetical protein n=1 Tax=Clostridium paraputrificum TaxID=29363 RepID=UPI0018972E33|nr:hypothetical protein [Clostridium paraputrificum]MDB2123793.1 hypothetical protein [Clostridium paraputrificum]
MIERILILILECIEKVPYIIMRILIMPLIVFVAYISVFSFGLHIGGYFYKHEDVFLIVIITMITSLLSFIITFIVDCIYTKRCKGSKRKFKNWFEWSHLIIMYFSGMITFIIALKPIFDEANIQPINIPDEVNAIIIGIFFIATFNYYFYKAFVTSKDINLFNEDKNM